MTKVKVAPYRMIGAVQRGGVYHDRADCRLGSRIHSDQLSAGTGGLTRCPVCVTLDEHDGEREPPLG